MRALVDAVPSGSYLAIAHPASDVDQYVGPALRQLSTRMGGTRAVPRSHQQVSSFFDGLDLVEPGVVQLHRWRPGSGVDDTGRDLAAYGAVAQTLTEEIGGSGLTLTLREACMLVSCSASENSRGSAASPSAR